MTDTATVTHAGLARRYLDLQRENKLDDLLALMADDVSFTLPMAGTTTGKPAVEKQFRARPAGERLSKLDWADPTEDGDTVTLVGTGGQFGAIRLMLTFNAADEVCKIEIGLGATPPDNPYGFVPPPLSMAWAKAPTERPPLPKDLGPEGFTLRLADAGGYAWAPDHWPYQNDTPRGAWPAPLTNRGLLAPYTIYDKHEVWADSSADLYELAIRERWVPATEISWGSIEPLPDHIEASIDQIMSNISEQSYNSCQVLSGWLKEISYGFHEVKLYLATQVFDQARHTEVFRKRALANGGGLGVQSPGFFSRTVYGSFKFTEFTIYVNIMRTSFLLALCEFGLGKIARSQVDRQLFELTAKDLRRHLAYGVEHLRHYVLQGGEQKRRNVRTWLDRGEVMMAVDLKRDKAMREAVILATGDTVAAGKAGLKELREAQLKRYLQALDSAAYRGRGEHIVPTLREVIETP